MSLILMRPQVHTSNRSGIKSRPSSGRSGASLRFHFVRGASYCWAFAGFCFFCGCLTASWLGISWLFSVTDISRKKNKNQTKSNSILQSLAGRASPPLEWFLGYVSVWSSGICTYIFRSRGRGSCRGFRISGIALSPSPPTPCQPRRHSGSCQSFPGQQPETVRTLLIILSFTLNHLTLVFVALFNFDPKWLVFVTQPKNKTTLLERMYLHLNCTQHGVIVAGLTIIPAELRRADPSQASRYNWSSEPNIRGDGSHMHDAHTLCELLLGSETRFNVRVFLFRLQTCLTPSQHGNNLLHGDHNSKTPKSDCHQCTPKWVSEIQRHPFLVHKTTG